jgi:hypothetical protein
LVSIKDKLKAWRGKMSYAEEIRKVVHDTYLNAGKMTGREFLEEMKTNVENHHLNKILEIDEKLAATQEALDTTYGIVKIYHDNLKVALKALMDIECGDDNGDKAIAWKALEKLKAR